MIKETKPVLTKAIPIKSTSTKTVLTNVYILPAFLLIAKTLLIAVSVYCCFIKYRAKQKHLLPYHDTSKLKKNDIESIL